LDHDFDLRQFYLGAASYAHHPKDGFSVHRSGEGMEEAPTLLVVEIGQDRFDSAGNAELAIDVVEMGLHGIE
jgi:hypothetical protein